jgi:hypothetical protein
MTEIAIRELEMSNAISRLWHNTETQTSKQIKINAWLYDGDKISGVKAQPQ